jgi:hypothetical protein
MWGIESPLFKAKVLAQFPDITANNLWNVKDAERAMSAEAEAEGLVKWLDKEAWTIGVDCARFGDDSSVIMILDGNRELPGTEEIYQQDTTYVAGRAKERYKELRKLNDKKLCIIAVDAGGLGAGVVDQLKNDTYLQSEIVSGRLYIFEVNFGESETKPGEDPLTGSTDALHYVNAISQMAKLTKDQAETPEGFILQQDDDFAGQLTDRRYKYDTKGMRFQIESKAEYKKRHNGKSPDKADAFMLAWYGYTLVNAGSGEWDSSMTGRDDTSMRDKILTSTDDWS